MASRSWLGRAKKVAQISTITVTGPIVAAETFMVTINGKSITFTATAGTTSNVVTGLQALLAAATAAEFLEGTWAAADPDITMTAKTAYAGVPITITVSHTSFGGNISVATTVAATGPEFLGNILNWSGSTLPVDADNIYFGPAEYGPKYGLTELNGVTPALIDIDPQATYAFGLPVMNAAGGYTEYRTRYVTFDGCTLFRARKGTGNGSGLSRFDFLATAVAAVVESTGATTETGAPALNIIGTNANNSLEVQAGDVGWGAMSGDIATLKTHIQAGGTVVCGAGVTLSGAGSTIDVGGGTFKCRSATLTVTVDGGATFECDETGTMTTLTVHPGATCKYRQSGTCTAATIYGTLDCSEDRSARIFTTLTVHPGAIVNGLENVTITNFAKAATVSLIQVG